MKKAHCLLHGSLLMVASAAWGAGPTPAVGTVQGVVVATGKVDAPATQHVGFVSPIENPVVDLRQYDPLPEMIVYLDGPAAAADASTPSRTPVIWQLQSSFSPPILPVVTGSLVEINNVGRETHLLYSPNQAELVSKEPLGPDISKQITVSGKDVAVTIRSKGSPHVEGRIVPLPTRYFARVDRAGKFKIDNVPPGHWNVRVWYRDGWLTTPAKAVDVPQKGDVRVELSGEQLSEKKKE